MNFAHHNLPLEYLPKEMLRIYRDRLLVFSGVVMANLILLILVVFALSEPGIFVVATALIGAFVVVCWWSSRDASLVKLQARSKDESLDLAADAEAIAAIWALLGVSSTMAAPRHHQVGVSFGPLTLREVLEEAKRFQNDVVGEYFQSVVKNHETQSEKEQWLRLVAISESIVDQIGTAIEAIPSKDMGKGVGPDGVLYRGGGHELFLWPRRATRKDMSRHGVRFAEVQEVYPWLFAGRIIANIEGLRRMSDAKAKCILDLIPTESNEGSIVAWYVTSAVVAWGFLSREHLTSPTVQQIKSIMLLAEELRDELNRLKGDSTQGNDQGEKK